MNYTLAKQSNLVLLQHCINNSCTSAAKEQVGKQGFATTRMLKALEQPHTFACTPSNSLPKANYQCNLHKSETGQNSTSGSTLSICMCVLWGGECLVFKGSESLRNDRLCSCMYFLGKLTVCIES